MGILLRIGLIGAALLAAACTQSPAPGAATPQTSPVISPPASSPTPPAIVSPAPSPPASSAVIPTPGPTVRSPASTPAPSPASTPAKPLSSLEQKLVGTWGRYHRQSESYKQFVFSSDRTACYLEISRKSNRIEDERPYPRWELDEKNPLGSNIFSIVIEDHGRIDQFHYKGDHLGDRIWQGGYENLQMGRATPSNCSK